LVNNFGELFKGVKSGITATLEQVDGTQSKKDVTADLKMNKENNQG
jgi:hypothetical protein